MRVGVSPGAKPEQNSGAVEDEVLLACALSEKDMTGGFSLSSVRFAAPPLPEWTNARENAGLISKIDTHGSIRCQLPIEGLDVAHGLAGIPHRCPLHLNKYQGGMCISGW